MSTGGWLLDCGVCCIPRDGVPRLYCGLGRSQSSHMVTLERERKWRSPFIAMHNRSYEHDSSAVNSCGDSKTI